MNFLQREILNSEINLPICFAPMVGLSHVAVREAIRGYLPSGANTIWPTEMLNSRRIPAENLSTTAETLRSDIESHLVPQILGNEEDKIKKSIVILKDWGAEGIDINMGCPVRKALKHNYGVALMGDPDYAAEVVSMAVKSSNLPVSVKLRAGQQDDISFLLNFVKGIEESGASWICLHPRTAAEKRRGRARWEQVAQVRDTIAIPVIGNGDVQNLVDVKSYFEVANCDMVMVGRALTARPWLLWQLGQELGFAAPIGREGHEAPCSPEEEAKEYGRFLIQVAKNCFKYFSPSLAHRKLKFFVRHSSVWIDYGFRIEGIVTKNKELPVLIEELERFFKLDLKMLNKTNFLI